MDRPVRPTLPLLLFFALFAVVLAPQVHAAKATAFAGRPVTLAVAATGTAPFTYRWYRNGVPIADATGPTYVISRADAVDAGSYYVVVSNPAGSIVSDQATLAVQTGPVATPPPAGAAAASDSRGTVADSAPPAATKPSAPPGPAATVESDAAGDPRGASAPAGAPGAFATSAGTYTALRRAMPGATGATDWRVVRIDLGADGETEVSWQNDATGESELWIMDGGELIEVIPMADIPPETPPGS